MSYYADDTVTVHHGDCLDILATLPDASVDAVVTDPPYGLEFMGKEWDAPWKGSGVGSVAAGFNGGGIDAVRGAPSYVGATNPRCLNCGKLRSGGKDKPWTCVCDAPAFPDTRTPRLVAFQAWCELWVVECLRVLKPGGHLLAFGGTRTSHRLACAIEDAGFEIRDSIAWLYGSGFSKGGPLGNKPGLSWCECGENPHGALDDRARRDGVGCPRCGGFPQAFRGFSTTLKPAHEPVVVARKPLAGTVAGNVLAHGTGALNIDGCRVGYASVNDLATTTRTGDYGDTNPGDVGFGVTRMRAEQNSAGRRRWPANVVLDESQAAALDQQSGELPNHGLSHGAVNTGQFGGLAGNAPTAKTTEGLRGRTDTGGASRFFYTAKADAAERVRIDGTAHPTVKPLALMRWLVRLVTPPGGIVLEPFAGSGTTVEACILEGFRCVAIEREADYLPLILQRIHRRRDPVAAVLASAEDGGLFDLLGEAPA